MSFIYPRTVAVTRPNRDTTVGFAGYSGLSAADETAVVSGLAASIQLKKQGGAPEAKLPGDVAKKPFWAIFIRRAALGVIRKHDIITDDLGNRYQVDGCYWNSLGYNILAEELGT